MEIPRWFGSESIVIELPKNWRNGINEISLCVVADLMGLTRPISLTLSTNQISSKNMNGMYHSDGLHLRMEYVSLDLLQRSCEGIVRNGWITTTPGLIMGVETYVLICLILIVAFFACNLYNSNFKYEFCRRHYIRRQK